MPTLPWILTCLVLLASPLPAPAAPARQACTGCNGAGGTSVSSGGTCGGRVEISVAAGSGECKWFLTDEPLLFECKEIAGCETTIVRSWIGLPPGSIVDFCIEVEDETLCLQKKTVVDVSGAGSSTRNGPVLVCTDSVAEQLTFQVAVESCGLAAEVTPTCSGCLGDF